MQINTGLQRYNNNISLKSNNSIPFKGKTEDNSGKNTAPAIASFFIPGVGQFMNKENGKGFNHLISGFGVPCLSGLVYGVGAVTKNVGLLVLGVLGMLGGLAVRINSTIDAYNYKEPKQDTDKSKND